MKYLRYILWGLVFLAFVGFIALNLPPKDGSESNTSFTPLAGFNKGVHFTLTTHTGETFNSATDIPDGHYALIFFGFTHCPVICPTELQKFAFIMDGLNDEVADKIHPLFITIDPERDTKDVLNTYVPQFHEKIVGLTGNTQTVHDILNDWKVYFAKVNDPQYTEYTMDHSTYSYLVDSDMTIVALYRMKSTEDEIIKSIHSVVQ